jgi:gluconolactonase
MAITSYSGSLMAIEAESSRIWELIEASAALQKIATGFTFTEGPIWHPVDHHLLFSDMPADVRRRFRPDGVVDVKRPANKCNGMTYDSALNLIVCEHATSSLIREQPNGRREVLASEFEGKELNSPNDVCVRSDGSIYFSDPWYGRMPVFGVERPRQLGWQGVFRVPPAGGPPELVVARDEFDMPNGLCFSPDETRLYINDTSKALIKVYDVAVDGSLSNGRVFAQGLSSASEPGRPDGMKCDAQGNVWVTAPGGVWILDSHANILGRLRVAEVVGNLSWGGDDWRTLFLTASTSLYAIETRVGPRTEPYMLQARAASRNTRLRQSRPRIPEPGRDASGQLILDPQRCALIIQDMQNDVISPGGAFASSGAPDHAAQQNVVANVRKLAAKCRRRGVPVIHVWFIVEPGAPGLTLNAPLFRGVKEAGAMVRGTWGASPVDGLGPISGDHVVEKMRMSAWQGTRLETVLRAECRDTIIVTGAWTNMSIEHTARTGADRGYVMVVPEDCCSTMNADWHRAAIDFALQNVSIVSNTDEVIAAIGEKSAVEADQPIS